MQSEEQLYKTIGENVFYYRLKKRLSLQELLLQLQARDFPHLSKNDLNSIESGTLLIEIPLLIDIAEILQIDLADLLRPQSFSNFIADFGAEQLQACYLPKQ